MYGFVRYGGIVRYGNMVLRYGGSGISCGCYGVLMLWSEQYITVVNRGPPVEWQSYLILMLQFLLPPGEWTLVVIIYWIPETAEEIPHAVDTKNCCTLYIFRY